MTADVFSLLKILTLALAAGGTAEFFLRTNLSESWVMLGGLAGVAIDSCIPIAWGPTLFGHCLIDCVAASAIMIMAVSLLQLPLRVSPLRPRHNKGTTSNRQPLRTRTT